MTIALRAAALGALVVAASARAVAPSVESIYPAGGRRGTSVAVTVTAAAPGKFDAWPPGTWTDSPSIRIEPGKVPGALTFQIARDAAVGPHLFRLHTADGASPPRCFMVGEQAELQEVEPNDEAGRMPQVVGQLPATINGQLDKSGDVECFAVKLEAGQTLVASVAARRLGAMIDPMLHLFGPDGRQVAFAHDGLGLDPLLAWRAERAGTYVVRLSAFAHPPAAEVKLAGGKNAAYRLSLTTGPFGATTFPLGVRRGGKSTVRAVGWNLASETLEVDATHVPPGVEWMWVAAPGAESPLRVEVGDGAEVLKGGAVVPPAALNGVLSVGGAEDRYPLAARKGERLTLAVRASAARSPLEPLLVVRDGAGQVLASAGESGAPGDPKLEWTPLADGPVTVGIADLFHKGGADYLYRVEVMRPRAEASATVDAESYALVPGKTVGVKVTVARRNGHATGMVAVATGLPAGVTGTTPVVPVKGGEVTVTLTAAPGAKAAAGPMGVLLVSMNPLGPEVVQGTYDLTKDVDKAGGQSYVERTGGLWLTVSATASTERPNVK